MSAASRGLQGGLGGAAAGSVIGGPIGGAIGGLGGLLVGGLFGADEDKAAKRKQKMLHEMAIAYQAQRPELAQSQTNALNQTLSAYAPSNQMIGDMYGSQYMQDLDALGQNPMTPGMMNPGVGPISKLQGEVDQRKNDPAGYSIDQALAKVPEFMRPQMRAELERKAGYSGGLKGIG